MDKGTTSAADLGRERTGRAFASLDASELGRRAKEAAYTLVGLGVMGAQRANVATREAVRKLGRDDVSIDLDRVLAKTKDLSSAARRQFGSADDVLTGALARIEDALGPLGERLPGSARETVDKVRDAGRELHAQVRTLVAGDHVEDRTDGEAATTPED